MNVDKKSQPIFNAPGVVLLALVVLAAVHAILGTLPQVLANEWLWRLAFIPARYGPGGSNLTGGLSSQWLSPLTHMFVHGDIIHLAFNSAWLLAFGTAVAQRMSATRFLVYALLCGLGGALLFFLMNAGKEVAMVGASGAVSGLMGGVFRFLFNAQRFGGYQILRAYPRLIPRMTLGQAIRSRGVVIATLVWLGVNLLFATDLSHLITEGEIAWEAHVGGFLVGFLTFGWFDQAEVSVPIWFESNER